MKPINRREFVSRTVAGVAALYLYPLRASARVLTTRDLARLRWEKPVEDGRFFVMIGTNMSAGLDCTLGLDPQIRRAGSDEKDMFIEYRPEDIIQASGLRLAPAAAPLVPHASDFSIINGIFMRRDSGHGQLLEYMQSGDPTGNAASLAIEYATRMPSTPMGTIFDTFSVKQAGHATIVSNAQSLDTQLSAALSGTSSTDFFEDLIEYAIPSLADAQKASSESQLLLPQLAKDIGAMSGPETKTMKILAAAFKAGASTQALLQISTTISLDTHTNHEKTHLSGQSAYWQQVADLFSLFKKTPYGTGSLFDATTFYVTSEFSRTPALNGSQGKDHNPFTNSALIAGRGVRGGDVYGASKLQTRTETLDGMPCHIGAPYDFESGRIVDRLADATTYIYPEHVVQTLVHILGISETHALKKGDRPLPYFKKLIR
jgi:hypothetical protein